MTDLNIDAYSHLLVIDLEATCSTDDTISTQEMETIEIGAVMLDAEDHSPVDEFCTFVRPVRNPTLTPFCTELTSITQPDVEDAPHYREAIEALKTWMHAYGHVLFCSWGDYDRIQFKRDCAFHDVAYPFASDHLNLKKAFAVAQRRRKTQSLTRALRSVRLSFEGDHHRGIDDARNIARLVPYALDQNAPSDGW